MKTKLYTLLTSLLMAACISSYGQEIVNEFSIMEPNRIFVGCDIMENEDETLLIGAVSCTNPYYYDPEYLIYKTTPNGETLNTLSITVPNGMNGQFFTNAIDICDKHFLLRNATAPDSYIITNHCWDMANNHYFRMVSIDADLNVKDDISVPVDQGMGGSFTWDKWLIDAQNDIIISFWIDEVFHIMRIGLDGTVKTHREITDVFPPKFDYEYHLDTVLWYSGFGIFKESPLTYYKLGSYQTATENYPVHCYFFDEGLNIIGTHWFERYNEDILFSGGNSEHIIPMGESSYLMASEMEYPNGDAGSALIKFDMDLNPICISPEFGNLGYPFDTRITDDNSIFQLYVNFGNTAWPVSLACLDSELHLNWDVVLPGLKYDGLGGNNMIAKTNGDIVVAFEGSEDYGNTNNGIYVYTIRNTTSNTSEKTNRNTPFSLYPNPVKDHLTLRFDDGTEPESVELYDLAGRLVGTKPNGQKSIDMGAMPSGVYMLRVTTKDGTSYHEKIVKE